MNARHAMRAIWRFPITRVAVFLILLLAVVYTGEYAFGLMWVALNRQTHINLLVSEIIQTALVFSVFVGMMRYAENREIISCGFQRDGILRDWGIGFALGTVLVCVVVFSLRVLGVYKIEAFQFSFDVFSALVLLLFAAFTEEIVFRGYILQTIERAWGTTMAVGISAFAFGFAHLMNEVSGASGSEKALSCLFLSLEAGLPLAAAYVLTRKLWMPIAMHWAWNFFEGPVFGTLVSGADFGKPLFRATMTGNFLLTGGAFGPEASLSGLVTGTVFAFALFAFAVKQDKWVPIKAAISEVTQDAASE